MSESSTNTLYRYFKERRFSELSFLYDEAIKSNSSLYLGLLYFLMDSKNEDKTNIFNELEKLLGSKSSAYLELAELSTKIYKNHYYIFRSYIENALNEDPLDIKTLYAMHNLTHDPKYILNILNIHNKNNDIQELIQAIYNINHPISEAMINSKIVDWNLIIEAYSKVNDDDNKLPVSALVLAYLKVKKIDLGLLLIKKSELINHYVLKSYMDEALLTEDEALAKVDVNLCHYITNDPQKIYKIYKKHFEKKEPNPTLSAIIQVAFNAKEYKEVIYYFNHSDYQNDPFSSYDSSIAYYLLANFFLTNKIDFKNYNKLLKSNILNSSDETIISIVKCYALITKLESNVEQKIDNGFLNFPIYINMDYKLLDRLLSQSDIISHVLYQDLIQRKKTILDKYEERKVEDFLRSDLSRDLDFDNPSIETLYDCRTLYHYKKFKELITALEKWHLTNQPSVISYKYIADSYNELGDKDNMFKYYKLAYELNEHTKENNYTIVFNYLYSLQDMHPDQIYEIDALKKKYNSDLASQFRIDYIHKKRFFKYCPFNINTIDALANQYFYFPDKQRLNDPIELPYIKYLTIPDDILNNYRIFSLSENSNSMLMWSHYADNHKGISIGYRFGDYLPHGVGISEVTYNNHLKRQVDLNDLTNRYKQHLLTKNEDWSYEREYRIFTTQDKLYYERFDYLDYDRTKIDAYIFSITLGCAFPDHKILLITQLISSINQKNPQNPKIILMKAEIPKDHPFSVEYKEVNY